MDPTVLMIWAWHPIVDACYFVFQWFHVIQISVKMNHCLTYIYKMSVTRQVLVQMMMKK